MDARAEDELVLTLTLEHVKETGAWPKLEEIHQKIHQGLHVRADVQESARRLAPLPFIGGGYSHLGETFVPPLHVVAQTEEGRRLIACLVGFIDLARERYENSRGQPEVTSGEVQTSLEIDAPTGRAVRELVHSVPWVTDGGVSNAEGWSVTVAHEITRWAGLRDGEDLLSRLEEVRRQGDKHLAALTSAKHRMVGLHDSSSALDASPVAPGRLERAARYLEKHPVTRIAAIVGLALGVVVAVVSLIRA
jgi:hypothetical protein